MQQSTFDPRSFITPDSPSYQAYYGQETARVIVNDDPSTLHAPAQIVPFHGRILTNIPETVQSVCLEIQLDGPAPLQTLGAEILRLQAENLALKEKQAQFRAAVALHMENNYQLIIQELYKLIKSDPKMMQMIRSTLAEEQDMTVSQLFSQTEQAVAEEKKTDDLASDWIEIGEEGAYKLVNIDTDLVSEIKSQIEALNMFAGESKEKSPQEILKKVAEIEKTLPKKPSIAWCVAQGTLTGISTLLWYSIKTTVLVAHSAIILAPTVAVMLPMIAPTAYLKLLLYLITLLNK